MGHKSWGGARPNKWDREFHDEPEGKRYYVTLDVSAGKYKVIDSAANYAAVFVDEDKLTCECECDLLNSQEHA